MIKIAKTDLQPIIFTFLLKNCLTNQIKIWNESIENVNNISEKLLMYYLNN